MAGITIFDKNDLISNENTFVFNAKGLHLEQSLFCGQCFSWFEQNGVFSAVIEGQAVNICEANDFIYILDIEKTENRPEKEKNAQKTFWQNYFALDTDYAALHAAYKNNDVLWRCVEHCPGLRLFNQPFFETLISFIISQNNNIPRITGILARLRENFGTKTQSGLYTFPSAKQLAGVSTEDFACLRAGFRAKYLVDAVEKFNSGLLCEQQLRALPVSEARQVLMQVKGIGPKVADCVLLYSLGAYDVVPMDVWMKRAVDMLFSGQMPAEANGSQGIAQLYIFNYARQELMKDGKN